MTSVFDFAGPVLRGDLESAEWQSCFATLETLQGQFLSHDAEFRSPEYKWPRDALHNWSRVWEYPFAHHQISKWLQTRTEEPNIVDLGSGVTFFPWAVAKLGAHVTCLDVDPICAKDIPTANVALRSTDLMGRGSVDFRLIAEDRLPYQDQSVDAVYCISVLEHIPNYQDTIREVARILRPDGLFVLTVDLDLRGDQAISAEGLERLRGEIEKHFTSKLTPRHCANPAGLLTSLNSPWGCRPLDPLDYLLQFAKQKIAKPLLGRAPGHVYPYYLAIYANAYTPVH